MRLLPQDWLEFITQFPEAGAFLTNRLLQREQETVKTSEPIGREQKPVLELGALFQYPSAADTVHSGKVWLQSHLESVDRQWTVEEVLAREG